MANQGSANRFVTGLTPRPASVNAPASARRMILAPPRSVPQDFRDVMRLPVAAPRSPFGYTLDLPYPPRGQAVNPDLW